MVNETTRLNDGDFARPETPEAARRFQLVLPQHGIEGAIVVNADSAQELMDTLINGYSDMSLECRRQKRHEYIRHVQQSYNSEVIASGGISAHGNLSMEELSYFKPGIVVDVTQWDAPIPLVVVPTDYFPYGGKVDLPTSGKGTVHILSAVSEKLLLNTISRTEWFTATDMGNPIDTSWVDR